MVDGRADSRTSSYALMHKASDTHAETCGGKTVPVTYLHLGFVCGDSFPRVVNRVQPKGSHVQTHVHHSACGLRTAGSWSCFFGGRATLTVCLIKYELGEPTLILSV